MSIFINADGGLTTPGYLLSIALIVLALLVAAFTKSGKQEKSSVGGRKLTFCAMSLALAAVTSMIKVFSFPFGGSVTLCSMLFAMLPAWFYGTGTGLLCGFIYGLLQFITGPYFLTLPQFLFDYIFAFMIMGFAGIFAGAKNGLIKGYIVAIIGRWAMATIAGLIWVSLGSTAWDGWAPLPYSMAYNGIYIGAEAIFTLVILCIPAVKNAFANIKKEATK